MRYKPGSIDTTYDMDVLINSTNNSTDITTLVTPDLLQNLTALANPNMTAGSFVSSPG